MARRPPPVWAIYRAPRVIAWPGILTGPMEPPEGYVFLTDDDGVYLTDDAGYYLLGEA